jgi:hypothetical protein
MTHDQLVETIIGVTRELSPVDWAVQRCEQWHDVVAPVACNDEKGNRAFTITVNRSARIGVKSTDWCNIVRFDLTKPAGLDEFQATMIKLIRDHLNPSEETLRARKRRSTVTAPSASTPPTSTSTIPTVSIRLERFEGPINREGPQEVAGYAEADQVLARWAIDAPEEGTGYDKCGIALTFADGEQFGHRIDLQRTGNELLSESIKRTLNIASGRVRPAHWTEQQYKAILSRNPSFRITAGRLLDTYQLGDNP